MLELFSLKDRVALVTGASRGLGRPMAEGLARCGAHVVLVARDAARLAEVQAAIEAEGGKASVLAVDLADEAAVREGIRRVGADLGRLDICVNNAGIINWQPLLDSDVADFERIMATNVRATFVVSQECAALMRAGGRGGRIINISSILGTIGRAKLHAYCASKSAIVGLTRSLAAELGKDGVRVNAIGPGLIETRINAEARAKNPDMVANVMRHTPLNRAGRPEDIAGPAVFLASDMSSYVTGCIIMADGGFRTV